MRTKDKGSKLGIERFSPKYWNTEISQGLERYKKFFDQGAESIKVYRGGHTLDEVTRRLNCWWYLIETVLPAYFSSAPKVEINLRKRAGGTIYQIVSTGLERSTQYAMDSCFDFSDVAYNAAKTWALIGQAALWPSYEAEFEDREEEFELRETEDGLATLDGEIIKEDEFSEILEDEMGIRGIKTIEAKKDEKAILDLIPYPDYLESDARQESEKTWIAKRAYMSREQVEKVFGSDMGKKLSFDSYPEKSAKNSYRERNIYDGKAELWEIHCAESEKMYWLQAKGEKSILESGEPALKFEGFYPSVTIKASTDPESIIPVSDYTHAKDQILEVERLTTRIHATTLAIRSNAAYDATLGKEIEDILKGDLRMIPVKSWPAYKSRGGLQAGMEFLQVEQYIHALGVLVESRETALQKLYEIAKCGELLRGTSDPRKTATANRLENQWSSLQLIVRQNQFAKFIGDGISKLTAVIAQQFSPQKLFDTGDVEELIKLGLPQGADPQQAFQQTEAVKAQYLEICRNNIERTYRIEVSSDSMVALNEAQEREDGVALMQSAGGFFDQMKGLIEQYPPLAPFSMELFKNVIRRYRGGKELEPLFVSALGQVAQIAEQKTAQAAQQPPDPKMQEIQGRLQIADMEAQAKMRLAEIEGGIRTQEANINMQIEQMKAQAENLRAQNEIWKSQQDVLAEQRRLEIETNKVQVEVLKVQAETNVDMSNLKVIEENNRLQALLQAQAQDIEKTKIDIQSTLEQIRLLSDRVNQSEIKSAQVASKPVDGTTMPKIEIHNHPAKPSKRVGKFMPDGSVELSDISDDAEPTDLNPGRPKAKL